MGVAAVLCLAASALAQPVYEIGYRFKGGDEVVRVEHEPFAVEVQGDLVFPDIQELAISFPFATSRRQGLVATTGRLRRWSGALPELGSTCRKSVTFTDLVFASSGGEPIEVDMIVNYGRNRVGVTAGPTAHGAEVLTTVTVELHGDSRVGQSRLSFDEHGRSSVERTGFLTDLPADRHATVPGLTVPVNTPVSLRFEVERDIAVPAGAGFFELRLMAPEDDLPSQGLPTDRPVFVVPAGVTVHSDQAGIRDNRFIVCAADLDLDGELTLFDFLAFQNLFDDGDLLADFDGDGSLTLFDFLAFQTAFDTGC
ncbi:hypothetical protein AY599_15030 [Leptolyngbya valderiana BDU 20041]|nr:hypothetical protein AY599_15030 [Leptolyngbya valderiana BDU 20041]